MHKYKDLSQNAMLKLLSDYKTAVDMTTILSTTDKNGVITYANDKFCEISGYSLDELIGKNHNIVRHPDMPKEAFKDLWDTIQRGETWRGIVKNRAKDGSTYVVEANIIPARNENGEINEYIGIRRDITDEYMRTENIKSELALQKEEIKNLTLLDSVSGLPNHHAFCEFLRENKNKLTLIAFRVDHLQGIKDVLGYGFADAYMRQFVENVSSFFEGFTNKLGIYKIDTDDICIVLDGAVPHVEKITEDLLSMAKFFYATHNDISLSSPITVAAYTGTENLRHKIVTLLSYAFDKSRGERTIGDDESACFADELPLNIFWLGKYSGALADEQMVPFFQPIFNNKTSKIEKYECLARIRDNDKIISPDKFIDLATRAKQIPFLTKAIVRKAFETFGNHADLEFSINVSAMDLQDEFLLKQVNYWQEKTKIDPSRVVFEILESEDIYRYGILKKSIATLKDIGYKIAIDDFGTGYSNFISLFNYHVDYIKIDGSLIKGIALDDTKAKMVENLNKFIHMCGAQSIAEFVSDENIQKIALDIGIDYSQGYHIGAPSQELIV